MSVGSLFINADEFTILHQNLAVCDGGLALTAGHTEDHVTIDIGIGERGEGLVVHDDHVSSSADFEHAELVFEVLCADESVVLEQHIGDFAPTDSAGRRSDAVRKERP